MMCGGKKYKGLTGVLPLNRFLVGVFNPSKKYARQIELFPHGRDERKKIFETSIWTQVHTFYEDTPSSWAHSAIILDHELV